jgi:hypothetical protein
VFTQANHELAESTLNMRLEEAQAALQQVSDVT